MRGLALGQGALRRELIVDVTQQPRERSPYPNPNPNLILATFLPRPLDEMRGLALDQMGAQ